MPKNPLFRYTDKSNPTEINILESINQEFIQITGVEGKYFPKQILKSNNVFGEDIYKFNKFYIIPVRFDAPSEIFEQSQDGFSKFGFLSIRDIKFYISINEFKETLGTDFDTYGPPRIGDIFYFDIVKQYFEVTYITDEIPKYPFGTKVLFEVRVKKYEFQNDDIDIEEDEDLNTSLKSIIDKGANKFENIKDGFEEHVDEYSILITRDTKWGKIK
jgi:hypothetical protein